MAAPRKLWKTTIVVWSTFDPQKLRTTTLLQELKGPRAVIMRQDSELVSNPYLQSDGPPMDVFEGIEDS